MICCLHNTTSISELFYQKGKVVFIVGVGRNMEAQQKYSVSNQ